MYNILCFKCLWCDARYLLLATSNYIYNHEKPKKQQINIMTRLVLETHCSLLILHNISKVTAVVCFYWFLVSVKVMLRRWAPATMNPMCSYRRTPSIYQIMVGMSRIYHSWTMRMWGNIRFYDILEGHLKYFHLH